MHGDERRGAGGLHGHARAFQIELVRDAGAEEILVVENQRRDVVLGKIPAESGVHEVRVHRRASEDADAPRKSLCVAGCVFERLVRELEQDTVLRVHRPRLARREAEECRIECAGFVEHRRRFHIIRRSEMRLRRAGFQDFVIGKARDGFHSGGKVAPEFLRIPRAGKTARETHDGDVQIVFHHRKAPVGCAAKRRKRRKKESEVTAGRCVPISPSRRRQARVSVMLLPNPFAPSVPFRGKSMAAFSLRALCAIISSRVAVLAVSCGSLCPSRSAGSPGCARSDSAPCNPAAVP